MQLINKHIQLTVIRNTLDSSKIESYHGSNLTDLLKTAFNSDCLPSQVQLYHNDFTHNVTPKTAQDVNNLLKMQGKFIAVVVPHGLDPISWVMIGVSVLVSVGVALLMPRLLDVQDVGTQPPSPNNSLARRTNRERLGGRVPDIFGQVWAYPDLIAPSYSVYIDNEEIEYSLLCLGRGEYDIEQVRDNKTLVEQINGTTVRIYPPQTAQPSKQIGNNLTEKEQSHEFLLTEKYSSVNGQDLPPPDNFLNGDDVKIIFQSPNIVKIIDGNYSFKANFSEGDKLKINEAKEVISESDNNIKYNLDGNYIIKSIDDSKTIRLENPQKINQDWQKLIDKQDTTLSTSPTLTTKSNNLWQGWFYLDMDKAQGLMFTLIAPQGLYITSKDNKYFAPINLFFDIEIELLDDNNQPRTDGVFTDTVELRGRLADKLYNANGFSDWSSDNEVRKTSAQTYKFAIVGKARFRIRRQTNNLSNTYKKLAIAQNVKIKDLYTYRTIEQSEFANSDTTRISVKTKATESALSIKERKLNLLVTRKIRTIDKPNELTASKRAEDIIYHIATDPLIGNLTDNQIDIEQIKAEMQLQRDYFNTDKCAEFCHTFDQNNLSSEETLQTVAQAVFSNLYRYNNKLRLHFERPQPVGVAIFNSHNILPNSYERSESFGINKEFDGVTVKYSSPKDNAKITFKTVPTAVNADEKTLVGVRNKVQATAHAWRIWHKHLYSHKSLEFIGADESNIVIPSQRIEVADQLRANVMQGIVTDLSTDNNKIIITVSEPIADNVTDSHTIFIQMTNGLVDSMQVTKFDDYKLSLPRLPLHTISSSFDNVVQATYQLVAHNESKKDAYIVTSKTPSEGIANRITAINYDERYYSHDKSDVSVTIDEDIPIPA